MKMGWLLAPMIPAIDAIMTGFCIFHHYDEEAAKSACNKMLFRGQRVIDLT